MPQDPVFDPERDRRRPSSARRSATSAPRRARGRGPGRGRDGEGRLRRRRRRRRRRSPAAGRSASPSRASWWREPELLLLDEPTNHLDVDGILWLEELLPREPEAFVAVSHDRYFLEAVAGRVIELNRAFAEGLLDVRGRYSRLPGEEGRAARRAGGLPGVAPQPRAGRARVALAQGPGAHPQGAGADRRGGSGCRTSSRTSTRARRRRPWTSTSPRPSGRRSGWSWPRAWRRATATATIVRGLDLVLSPGTRLGLLGANGSGKTTLLRLLAGRRRPTRARSSTRRA